MPGLSLDAAVENVRALVAARDAEARAGGRRCRVSFQVTVQEANVGELADIVRLAAALGVDRVKLNHVQTRLPALVATSLRRSPGAIARWNAAVHAARAAAETARLPTGERVLLQNAVELAPDPASPRRAVLPVRRPRGVDPPRRPVRAVPASGRVAGWARRFRLGGRDAARRPLGERPVPGARRRLRGSRGVQELPAPAPRRSLTPGRAALSGGRDCPQPLR